ncbi:MAG: hypothetical protein ACRDP6_02880 [Actinoallomurus sp.]
MKKRSVALTAGAGLLACAGMAGFASSASAATNGAVPLNSYQYTMHTDDGDPGGVVQFAPSGDYVHLKDIEADGWAVHLSVTDATTGKHKYSIQVGGKNRYIDRSATMGSEYNLAENHIIKFTICLAKSGHKLSYCDTSKWGNSE